MNEENKRKSGSVEAVEEGVEASSQIESNGEWIPRHTLVHLKHWDIEGRAQKEEPTSPTIVNI